MVLADGAVEGGNMLYRVSALGFGGNEQINCHLHNQSTEGQITGSLST